MVYLVRALIAVVIVTNGYAFNLETKLAIVKEGRKGTYFGYSVAQHQLSTSSHSSTLLVGAPLGNTGQPGTNITGLMYWCPFSTRRDDCRPVNHLKAGELERPPPTGPSGNYSKDDQWLGVAISSQGPGQYVVVCAHRYVKYSTDYRYGLGICYSLKPDLSHHKVYPGCNGLPNQKGHEQYGYCQFGMDVEVAPDNTIVFGAPGSYTWTGSTMVNSLGLGIRDSSTWYRSDVVQDTAPVPPYSMLGFAVTSGKLFGKSERMAYVGGAPKSHEMGEVVIFEKVNQGAHLQEFVKFTGDEKMAFFGHSITTIDLNADGYVDLVVGSPYYRGEENDQGGAIYIYMNGPEGLVEGTEPLKITRPIEGASFGYVVKNIGDIDHDTYDDLAVGAPHEGNGAVFIYRGSADGIRIEPSQVIRSEELRDGPVTFGYSLSGKLDMDYNGYPDLTVGAFESDTIVTLLARPVINITTNIEMEPILIDPTRKNCRDGTNLPCFMVQPCFKFTAHPVGRFRSPVSMHYTLRADMLKEGSTKRVQFRGAGGIDGSLSWKVVRRVRMMPQHTGQLACGRREMVYVFDTNDIITPVKFILTNNLTENVPAPIRAGDPIPDMDRYPIISELTQVQEKSVNFINDCQGNVCYSDLIVKATWNVTMEPEPTFVLGEEKSHNLTITISVSNIGEPAYAAVLMVSLPSFVDTYKPEVPPGVQTSPGENSTFMFTIGNPIPANETVADIKIILDTTSIPPTEKEIVIDIVAKTTSEELTPGDNQVNLQARIILKAEMAIVGYDPADQILFSGKVRGAFAMKKEEDIGSPLQHMYIVSNQGPGKVGKSTVTVHWPFEVENGRPHGKYLLYMITVPELHGPGECFIDSKYVNPLYVRENLLLSMNYRLHVTQLISEGQLVPELAAKRTAATRASISSQTGPKNSASNVNTIEKENEKEFVRSKRSAEPIIDSLSQNSLTLDCESRTAKCFKFVCEIGELQAGQTATIQVRARLWNSTFVEDYSHLDYIKILSHAELKIDPSLNVQQNTSNDRAYVVTKALPDAQYVDVERPVPLWVIVVSVLAGIVVLILLVLVLFLCGFFKRSRPKTETVNVEKSAWQ